MNAKHVQSQSTEKNSTKFLLKEQNLESAIPWTTNNHFCIVMWERCNSIWCRVNMIEHVKKLIPSSVFPNFSVHALQDAGYYS